MRIGLYDKPTNDELPKYKGLYRQNDLVDFCERQNDVLTNMVEWFFEQSTDGMNIEYTEANENKTIQLLRLLRDEKWDGELVLFTDENNLQVPFGFELLGYDICADSMYYSPLGDGFLASYAPNETFFFEMSFEDYREYRNDLNEVGLFNSYVIADNFSQYCNRINNHYSHVIESEENWRPVAIWLRCVRNSW